MSYSFRGGNCMAMFLWALIWKLTFSIPVQQFCRIQYFLSHLSLPAKACRQASRKGGVLQITTLSQTLANYIFSPWMFHSHPSFSHWRYATSSMIGWVPNSHRGSLACCSVRDERKEGKKKSNQDPAWSWTMVPMWTDLLQPVLDFSMYVLAPPEVKVYPIHPRIERWIRVLENISISVIKAIYYYTILSKFNKMGCNHVCTSCQICLLRFLWICSHRKETSYWLMKISILK